MPVAVFFCTTVAVFLVAARDLLLAAVAEEDFLSVAVEVVLVGIGPTALPLITMVCFFAGTGSLAFFSVVLMTVAVFDVGTIGDRCCVSVEEEVSLSRILGYEPDDLREVVEASRAAASAVKT